MEVGSRWARGRWGEGRWREAVGLKSRLKATAVAAKSACADWTGCRFCNVLSRYNGEALLLGQPARVAMVRAGWPGDVSFRCALRQAQHESEDQEGEVDAL